MRIAVTGADGFVGRAVVAELAGAGHDVLAVVRRSDAPDSPVRRLVVPDLGTSGPWQQAFGGVDAIIHLVAKTHSSYRPDPETTRAYEHANVESTLRIAEAAECCRVARVVYLSSVKAVGERTDEVPIDERTVPAPEDLYGRTKLVAEQRLREHAEHAGFEWSIVRPVLVVGPGARGNLPRLFAAVRRGLPLPFASIQNRRSMIGLRSLASLVALATTSQHARNEVFMAADPAPLSTPALLRAVGDALGRRAVLLPFPSGLLQSAAAVLPGGAALARLVESLEVDSSKATDRLGWRPRPTLLDELAAAAREWARSAATRGT